MANTDTHNAGSGFVNEQVLESARSAEPVQPMALTTINQNVQGSAVSSPRRVGTLPLESMYDVPITLVFEVGRTDITIRELMEMCEGSYIELRHVSVDSIDVCVNETIIASAETIALPQRYGIRFGEVELPLSIQNGEDSE